MLVELLLVGGGMVGVGRWLVGVERKMRARTTAAWEEAARRLGGMHTGGDYGSLWHTPTHRLRATVDTVGVAVDHYAEGSGKSRTLYTRCSALVPTPRRLEIKLTPQHIFTGLATALGAQDIRVGDHAFDAAFVIKSDQPELARLLLGPRVRRLLLSARDFSFVLNGAHLRATVPVLLQDPARLEHSVRATAALAASGWLLGEHWRALTEALGGRRIDDRWAMVVPCPGGQAEIGVDVELLCTRVHLPASFSADDRLVVTRGAPPAELGVLTPIALDHVPDGWHAFASVIERGRARLDARVCGEIDALACLKLQLDQQGLTLWLPGLEPDAAQLQRALALLASLAGAGAMPYR